jgi:hypothetical protein
MSKNQQLYTSEELSLSQAHNYTLLLQVDTHTFSYAIVSNKQLLAWGEDYELEELREPQQLRDILTANYKKVIVGLNTTGLTLLPNKLFDSSRISDIARLLDVNSNEKVIAEALDNRNMIIYKVNEMLTNRLVNLNNQQIVYSDAGWIKTISKNYPLSSDLYLNIKINQVSVLNFKNQNLRFFNTYTFNNQEELAYFCALVAKELDLQPVNTRLILSGDIHTTDLYFTYLKEFFGEVKINSERLLDMPADMEAQKILALSALLLCASSEEN